MRGLVAWGIALLLLTSAANADWLEVSSDHFVIYGDQDEKSVRRFAERLELFHAAMAYHFKKQHARPSPSNRVTIYIVGSQTRVRQLAGDGNKFVAGIYIPRAGATMAVIPRLTGTSSKFELSPETILYHEYAHHFMYGLTARTFPRWFVEGFAEFFAGVRFESDGGVGVGAPADHRAVELLFARQVPIRKMLDIDGGTTPGKSGYDAFYGQSWLLYHYLNFALERAGQLEKYQALLGEGKPALAAAEGAFGDLDRLDKDLEAYHKHRKLSYVVINRKALQTGAIAVRVLRPGEAEMMPILLRSKRGVTAEQALQLLPDARKVAARHPDDAAVLAALAEAESDAGSTDAAIVAADRALALDSGQIDAHIQKGNALFRRAEDGALPKVSWKDVRSQFVRANKVENDHPIPLIQYYRSFIVAGDPPTRVAIEGLEWAMVLAPFDASLRWLVVQQMISDDRLPDAARTLAPLAYSPHHGTFTETSLQLLKEVEGRIASAQGPSAD